MMMTDIDEKKLVISHRHY